MRWDYPPLDINPVFPGLGNIIINIIIIIIAIIIIITIIIILELLIVITNASLKTTVHYLSLISTFFEVCIT